MTNEQKIQAVYELVASKTIPKDQFGFYTDLDLIKDIANIINR